MLTSQSYCIKALSSSSSYYVLQKQVTKLVFDGHVLYQILNLQIEISIFGALLGWKTVWDLFKVAFV